MAKPFHELRERLLRAGVAPRHVRRYLAELSDHLADLIREEEQAGRSSPDAHAAALARLGSVDSLAKAMTEQSRFRSFCSRAPWAIFGMGPLVALAAAWFLSAFLLWVGWSVFLPNADTPFGARHGGPVYAFQNIYFQADKFYYFCAPFLVGWGVAVLAGRQRMRAVWPIAGLILLAWMGGMAQIQASRSALPNALGHIRMNVGILSWSPRIYEGLWNALVIFSLTAAPYLIWRWREARSVSSRLIRAVPRSVYPAE